MGFVMYRLSHPHHHKERLGDLILRFKMIWIKGICYLSIVFMGIITDLCSSILGPCMM